MDVGENLFLFSFLEKQRKSASEARGCKTKGYFNHEQEEEQSKHISAQDVADMSTRQPETLCVCVFSLPYLNKSNHVWVVFVLCL